MNKFCPHCGRTTVHKRKVLQWIPLAFLSAGMAFYGATEAEGATMLVMAGGGAAAAAYLVVKGFAGRFKVRWECTICKNEN